MNRHWNSYLNQKLSRRELLRVSSTGFGALAFAGLAHSADNPLAVRSPHFEPKAKRVIFLFQEGAPSQMDLYDPKPLLAQWHGKSLPPSLTKDMKLWKPKPSRNITNWFIQMRKDEAMSRTYLPPTRE